MGSSVWIFQYTGSGVNTWFSLNAYPSGWTYGVNVAGGNL
jgi:hypothetical protein